MLWEIFISGEIFPTGTVGTIFPPFNSLPKEKTGRRSDSYLLGMAEDVSSSSGRVAEEDIVAEDRNPPIFCKRIYVALCRVPKHEITELKT